jgi:DNA-directed RNA polymerase subunit beta
MAQTRNFDNSLFRKSFSNNADRETIPHLICVQKESYEKFLQIDVDSNLRENVGIQSVFNSFFPVSDSSNRLTVEFLSYDLKQPRYEASECLSAGRTFSSSLSAQLRLILWHQDDSNSVREIKSIKEQEVYLCEIPLMTQTGSFIVNGAERVIVSQMRRAPGVFFDSDNSKISGSKSYTAKIIPYIGSWIDFEFDSKDILHFRVDKKRKIPATSLLRSIGFTSESIINSFYGSVEATLTENGWALSFDVESFMGKKIAYNLVCANTGEVIIKEGTKINRKIAEKLDKNFKHYLITDDVLLGYIVTKDLIESETGELLLEAGSILTPESLEILKKLNFFQT